jgi:hypothetical protein
MKKVIFYLFVGLILTSCGGGGGGSHSELYNHIMKGTSGIFRGADMGMSIDDVKKLEDAAMLTDDEEDYLYYDYNLGGDDSYTVSYTFYDEALVDMEVQTYIDSKENAAKLFTEMKATFDEKYGNGTLADDGYTVWKGKAGNGNNFEIALIDDSDSYGYVQMFITDLDY